MLYAARSMLSRDVCNLYVCRRPMLQFDIVPKRLNVLLECIVKIFQNYYKCVFKNLSSETIFSY